MLPFVMHVLLYKHNEVYLYTICLLLLEYNVFPFYPTLCHYNFIFFFFFDNIYLSYPKFVMQITFGTQNIKILG